MLNFIICDDNKAILNRLSKMLESIFIEHNLDANVCFCSTEPEPILEYVKKNVVNAIFLDIDLKTKMSGLDLANEIRKINKEIYLIFTTAHLEYILTAYKYKTFDFLPKPITSERLEETILRMFEDMNTSSKNNKFIRLSNRNTIINQDTIQFIKKEGMKLIFHTDKRTYETYSSFKKILEELPDNFIQCHKSYIANMHKICDINYQNNIISFDNYSNIQCYIGPKYKNKLMEVLKNDGNYTNNLD